VWGRTGRAAAGRRAAGFGATRTIKIKGERLAVIKNCDAVVRSVDRTPNSRVLFVERNWGRGGEENPSERHSPTPGPKRMPNVEGCQSTRGEYGSIRGTRGGH